MRLISDLNFYKQGYIYKLNFFAVQMIGRIPILDLFIIFIMIISCLGAKELGQNQHIERKLNIHNV